MIQLTKLNGIKFALNEDLIETIQENPDTTIYLTNGNIYIVKEAMSEVISECVGYKRKIYIQSNLMDR